MKHHLTTTPANAPAMPAQLLRATEPIARLPYEPPYDWDWMLGFLGRRAISGVEWVGDGRWVRTLSLEGKVGRVCIRPDTQALHVEVRAEATLARSANAVCDVISRIFDLAARPACIAQALGPLGQSRPGLRLPGAANAFEFAVRAILEQQISTLAALKLGARLVQAFGATLPGELSELGRLFPSAQALAAVDGEELRRIGLPRSRAQSLHALARGVAGGTIDLTPPADIDEGIVMLESLPGIGPWTARYIAMRGWCARDVFLETDHAVGRNFPGMKPRAILQAAEKWRPYRSYAVLQLWGI